MLNTNEEKRTYTSNCINCLSFCYILRPSESHNKDTQIVITSLTEEEEQQLNAGKTIKLERDNNTFEVNPELCLAYGELDLSPNSKDINDMCKANWFAHMEINVVVLSDYDYTTHTVTSDVKGGRWYHSNNIKTFLPYLHGCIGKPKRVVIFKEFVNLIPYKKTKHKQKTKTRSVTDRKEQNKIKVFAKRYAKVSSLKFTIKR